MGIINWMQSRFHVKKENRIFDGATTIHESEKKHLDAELWPQQAGLLSIGTLGNEDPPPPAAAQEQGQGQDLPEEEVKKLQDVLTMLLRRAKSKSSARGSAAGEDDRFYNCPSCLEVDRRTTKHGECDDGQEGQEEGDLSLDTMIILTRARDLPDSGAGSSSIKQRLFKFLIKKMFACNGGFSAAPPRSLKDPVESRMEKFFQTVIGKKMNARPGNKGSATSRNYYLEDGSKGKRRGGRRCSCQEEEREESCRWVRTDSEYIVLEI